MTAPNNNDARRDDAGRQHSTSTEEDAPMPGVNTISSEAEVEAMEGLDNGRRLAPYMEREVGGVAPEVEAADSTGLQHSLDSVRRMRIELGTSPRELAAERLEDARTELIAAMRDLDIDPADRALHVAVAGVVARIDQLRVHMAGGDRGE